VSDRIAEIVVLCEDPLHFTFVNAYLGHWKVATGKITKNQGALGSGSGQQHVIARFPDELSRQRRNVVRRRAALIVIVDADTEPVEQVEKTMFAKLKDAEQPPPQGSEAVAILIPKRSVDTWIEYFRTGQRVSEDVSYKPRSGQALDRREVHKAAWALFQAVSSNSDGTIPVPSINLAVDRLRKFQAVAKGAR
jgi:hypothetical protein